MPKTNQRIVFLCPYPHDTAPGQRFRYEQYISFLTEEGYHCEIHSFLDQATNEILYKPGKIGAKISGIIKGFLQRFRLLFRLGQFDYVFIYREASPIGPAFFEWYISTILKRKIIIDFDDAIWINKTASGNPIICFLRNHNKIRGICKRAYKVSCGNRYLQAFAQQYNKNAVYVPTTLDIENRHNQIKAHEHKKKTIIGWTGTLTTLLYLDEIYAVTDKLAEKYNIELCIISNFPPKYEADYIRYIQWNKSSEIADLIQFDIGIMPMTDTEWERGKCGFKALQYMSLGIPAVVSPAGVNSEIIQDDLNGYLAEGKDEWYNKLEQLILSTELRQRLGAAGRKKVENEFSISSQKQTYLSLFS